MGTFSPRTASLLRLAGWYEGRAERTEVWEKALAGEGYAVGERVVNFLREFGGLKITYGVGAAADKEEWFHFDVLKTISDVYPDIMRAYGRRIGDEVCIIGEAFHDHMVLFMDGGGKVYGGYDSYLCLIGESGEDAIEALCSGREPTQILIDDWASL